MKRKWVYIAIAMCSIVWLAGCSADNGESGPSMEISRVEGIELTGSQDGATQNSSQSGGQSQATAKADEEALPATPMPAVAEADIPVISITTDQKHWYTGDGKVKLLQVKESILTVENEGFSRLQEVLSKRWNGIAEDSEYEQTVQMAQEQYDSQVNFFQEYFMEERVEPGRSDSRIVSFRVYHTAYLGGAHDNYMYDGVTFEVDSGKELTIGDILKDEEGFYLKAADYVIKRLERDDKNGLFPGYEETVADIFRKDGEICWYLNACGIGVMFAPYTFGPFAMGEVEITLPYGEFAPYIREEYLAPQENIIAKVSENEDMADLIGLNQSLTLEVVKNEEELYSITVVSGETREKTGTFGYFLDACLMKRADGRSFLLVACDHMSADYVTFLYEVTDGIVQKCDELSNARLSGTYMGTNRIGMRKTLDVLGTYWPVADFLITEDGKFVRAEEKYTIESDQVLTVTKELPVTMEGKEAVLPVGSQIVITGTNDLDTVYFEFKDSGKTGEIRYTRENGQSQEIIINGIGENEYFDRIPYAG